MTKRLSRALLALGLVAAAMSPVGAQTAPDPAASAAPIPLTGAMLGANDPCNSVGAIVTRPTQTTAVCTVRPGHVLLETGYLDSSGRTSPSMSQFPQSDLRIGTAIPALEVDLGLPMYERVSAAGTTTNGATDVGGGLKYVLGYTSRFDYGVNAFFTAPTGTNHISAGGSTQTYNLNYGYTLNSVFALAGTVGWQSLPASAQHYTSFIPSLMLTAGLPNATGLFVEAANFSNGAGAGTPTRTQLMTGITRDLWSRFQFDLEVGHSIAPAAGNYRFIGFGASYYH
jgi:hypothetical protein